MTLLTETKAGLHCGYSYTMESFLYNLMSHSLMLLMPMFVLKPFLFILSLIFLLLGLLSCPSHIKPKCETKTFHSVPSSFFIILRSLTLVVLHIWNVSSFCGPCKMIFIIRTEDNKRHESNWPYSQSHFAIIVEPQTKSHNWCL